MVLGPFRLGAQDRGLKKQSDVWYFLMIIQEGGAYKGVYCPEGPHTLPLWN